MARCDGVVETEFKRTGWNGVSGGTQRFTRAESFLDRDMLTHFERAGIDLGRPFEIWVDSAAYVVRARQAPDNQRW